ncbi:MFS transporter [Brevibacillus sp. SYP-B805]|uniref:MFS transporter n=1 Tax=Brevibacillus sp. SYP-B805 TaxID=1578199 RepID=UPI0013EA4B41|nr:MFS transporter [Brevibacillus sp. SYP-B805]NGQ96268.1 MFS transporter [Brevibacillus sp. SYP-B805]
MELEWQQQAGEKLMRILAFTLVISVMNATMFNIVLPKMSVDLHLSFSQASWVFAVYTLTYAIGSVIYGKLADTYKLKNLLTFGISLLFVGSLVGLAAQAYWMVLLGRILQAAGASVIPATAMIIPVRYFPAERRGRALGISATGLALGNALGPVVSALIVSLVHWRWLFCIPVFILFILPFYRKYLGDEQGKAGRIDWLGGGLLAGAVALLLLAVTNGGWILALASLMIFLLFIVRIRTAAEPFVQPRLFSNKGYSLGLSLAVLVMGIGYALPFLTPKLLADVNHLAPGVIGFAMVPAAVTSAILGRTGGKLADKRGNSFLFSTASVLLLICFVLLSSFTGMSPAFIAGFLIFGTVGQMFMQIALTNAISRTLPKEETGVGMGLLSMLNFLAGAVSTGIYSKIVDHGSGFHLNPLNAYQNAFVYSNLYFVLAMLHVGIFALYHLQFSRAAQKNNQTA